MLSRALIDNFVWRGHSLALLLLSLALVPFAEAQRAASVSSAHAAATVGRPAGSHVNGFSVRRGAYSHSGFRRSSQYPYAYPGYASLPFPFFGDAFDPSDVYSTGYPVASEPPPYVLQAARDMIASGPMGADSLSRNSRDSQSSQPLVPQPLVLERQGDRYVRVARTATNDEAAPLNFGSKDAPMSTQSTRSPAITASPANELVPAVLVFRDGHSEEVRDYTIADGKLYVRGDYYTDGYWNKKIELSSLDLSQTQQANANRNVKFLLPSSPNEVITRP